MIDKVVDWSPAPVEFGKDHWTTLIFVEQLCVDHGGKTKTGDKRLKMDGYNYPTKLRNGDTIPHHNDWDCIEDMIFYGMIEGVEDELGTSITFSMTELGWNIVGRLRRMKAEGTPLNNFDVMEFIRERDNA